MECKCKIDLLEHNDLLKTEYEKFVSHKPVAALVRASEILIRANDRPDLMRIVYFDEISRLLEEHLGMPYRFSLAMAQQLFACCLCENDGGDLEKWFDGHLDERYAARCLWYQLLAESGARIKQAKVAVEGSEA